MKGEERSDDDRKEMRDGVHQYHRLWTGEERREKRREELFFLGSCRGISCVIQALRLAAQLQTLPLRCFFSARLRPV